MNDTAATLMSIAMLGAFALLLFGARMAMKPDSRKQGGMMVVVGLILIANVLVWTI